jgi:hypothetical protein
MTRQFERRASRAFGRVLALSLALAYGQAMAGMSPPPSRPAPAVATAADGEAAFGRRQWQRAIGILKPDWDHGDRQFRVAYYLGASHCNIGNYPVGKAWFNHALTRTQPPRHSAQIIADALARCSTASPPQMAITTSEWSRTAELLYFGSDPRLRSRELSGADAVPAAVLARRLARVGDTAAIAATASALREALVRPVEQAESCAAGGAARAQVVGRFLFVTRVPTEPAVLDAWGRALEDYVQQLSTRFGMAIPADMITIHLARCPADARLIAKEVHGLDFDQDQIAGYSVQEDMSLLAIWCSDMPGKAGQRDNEATRAISCGYMPREPGHLDNEAMRTIRHELAHLVLHRWFGDAPVWLDEGLAQYLGVTAEGPEPGRTTVLASSWGALPSLAQVIAPPPPAESTSCVTVARRMMEADTARMFLAYVDTQPGRLRHLIDTMRAYVPSDGPPQTDAQLVETALGARLGELDTAARNASKVSVDDSLFHATTGPTC